MSLRVAVGWARSRFQSLSVVPISQWFFHGMTNSTDDAVRRIRPASPVIRSRGTTTCTPLDARTRNRPRPVLSMRTLYVFAVAAAKRLQPHRRGLVRHGLVGEPERPGDGDRRRDAGQQRLGATKEALAAGLLALAALGPAGDEAAYRVQVVTVGQRLGVGGRRG